jgi:hypothetical protein
MDGTTDPVGAVTPSIDHELRLVDEAVAMVESGAAPRVYLAGLRFGQAVIEAAREKAPAGVRIVPLWLADGSGADLAIERDVDEQVGFPPDR